MQDGILNLFRVTPQMPAIGVTLTGSEEIVLPSHSRIKGCQQLLLRRLSINNQTTEISLD